jgi:hypothetical protein
MLRWHVANKCSSFDVTWVGLLYELRAKSIPYYVQGYQLLLVIIMK